MKQILLIVRSIVGNQLRLALSLMHLKSAVDPMEFPDFAPSVEEMCEFMVPGAE